MKRLWSLLVVVSAGLAVETEKADAYDKPRVFVSDTQSWEMRGGFSASKGTAAGWVAAGARPQTVEVVNSFRKKCPGIVVTNNREKASYIVLFDHEGGKGLLRRDNKIAVFGNDGDLLHSVSTRTLGNAVKEACAAIQAAAKP